MSARTHEEARAADTQRLRDENEAAREMIRIYREDRAMLLNALVELELRTRQYLDGSLIQFPGALLLQCRDAIARAEGR